MYSFLWFALLLPACGTFNSSFCSPTQLHTLEKKLSDYNTSFFPPSYYIHLVSGVMWAWTVHLSPRQLMLTGASQATHSSLHRALVIPTCKGQMFCYVLQCLYVWLHSFLTSDPWRKTKKKLLFFFLDKRWGALYECRKRCSINLISK